MTSPEVRAELKKAGWVLERDGKPRFEHWVHYDEDGDVTRILLDRVLGNTCKGYVVLVLQFCAIAGMVPQGYAIVPVKDEHAKAMVADIASIFEGYDADKVVRELDEFFKEDDEEGVE